MKTTKKPPLKGNFWIARNGEMCGGWTDIHPTWLRKLVSGLSVKSQRDYGIDLAAAAAAIMMGWLDPDHPIDEYDGMLMVWYLAHNDPQWPRMMREFGRGVDFVAEIRRDDHGQPTVAIHRLPTPPVASPYGLSNAIH